MKGFMRPLCATPAKIITSEIRSGRSFTISPRALAFSAATATMPSSMLNQSRRKQNSGAIISSHVFLPDCQKHNAAVSAATIDKYEIASGGMPRRTHKFVAPSPVRRNICAIGRRDVGWYSTIPYALAKSQAHCPTNLAQNDSSKAGPTCIAPEVRHWNSRLNQFTIAAMKILTIIARVLLGLIFVVFGSNIFLHFIPMPPPPPTLIGDFSKALFLSHYVHVVGPVQVIGGALFRLGRFVPLGLTLLCPVIVNFDLVHIVMGTYVLPLVALFP